MLASVDRSLDKILRSNRPVQSGHRRNIAGDRPHAEMSHAHRPEILRLVQPVRLPSLLDPHVGLKSEGRDVAPLFSQVIPEPIDNTTRILARRQQRHPAVREARRSPQERLLKSAANPNGNRARRTRIDTDPIKFMPSALKRNELLGPELPHDGDLLLLPGATRLEVFVQRFVFRKVPADADTQPQALAREQIHLGGLLGDERRLALRENHDAGRELDSLRHAGQKREKRERLVELVVVQVWRRRKAYVPPGKSVGMRAEDVVICGQVIEPRAFGGLSKVPNRGWIGSDLGLRKGHSKFHRRYSARCTSNHEQNPHSLDVFITRNYIRSAAAFLPKVCWSTITRMGRALLFLLVSFASLALAQPGLAQNVAIVPRVPLAPVSKAPDPVLRVDSSLVLIPAHVTDAASAPIKGLTVNDFRLTEDGVEQTISAFTAEDAPVSVGLLFDASGSMRNKMEKASQAAAAFFRTANAQDEFFLVAFGGRTRLDVPFTTDSDELYQRIVHTRPSGQTPLFDAIHLALKAMKNARHSRKALVILSDGGDNWSAHSLRQIRSALVESDVQVYSMGIFDADVTHNHPREEKRGPMLLEDLTGPTGGRNFSVERLDDLPAIGERISRELRHEYLLGYYSTNAARDGKYRRVKVNLVTPGVKDAPANALRQELPAARVAFRPGYYAPAE